MIFGLKVFLNADAEGDESYKREQDSDAFIEHTEKVTFFHLGAVRREQWEAIRARLQICKACLTCWTLERPHE